MLKEFLQAEGKCYQIEFWTLGMKSIRNGKHVDKYQSLVFPLDLFMIQSKNYNTVTRLIMYVGIVHTTVIA